MKKQTQLRARITEINSITDFNTGEITEQFTKTHNYMTKDKETFFLGYSSLIGVFMEMNQAEIRIFGYCLQFAKGVKFDISKNVRLDISTMTGLNERTVLNTLPLMIDKGLLLKHQNGLYQINPRYAYEGSTTERKDALKVVIELGFNA